MVDIGKLPAGVTIDKDDFTFKYGTDDTPGDWTTAADPIHVGVRSVGGSDRITIIWADNAIPTGNWLEVTVLAADTGLASPDVFYFGNLIGDADLSGRTMFADLLDIYNHLSGATSVPITNQWDVDRDGHVLFADMNPTYAAIGNTLPEITTPAAPAPALPPGGAGDGAVPVALGAPPVPAVAPAAEGPVAGGVDSLA
jgi:hypothetical protein